MPTHDFFLAPKNLSNHMDRQARICDTVLICKPFKDPRNRFPAWRASTYLTYWPARLHRLAESIPGLLIRLQIRALVGGGGGVRLGEETTIFVTGRGRGIHNQNL